MPDQTASVIVHGPQGCGKTRHAPLLQRHFGLKRVVEADETPRFDVYRAYELHAGFLYLTNEPPPPWFDGHRRVLSFDQAMQLAEAAA